MKMKHIKIFEEFINEFEEYHPDEIKKILWNTFKEHARDIEYDGVTTDGNYVYNVIPEDTLTIELMNDVLGDLWDTELFDIDTQADGSIKITYFIQNKLN